ncbi:MAG TPA: hypothetical protein VF059_08730 [Casimicrobiaceae bacterium]
MREPSGTAAIPDFLAIMARRIAATPRGVLALALAAMAFVSAASAAAENIGPTVYKCTQANGAVLYADYPCRGSTVVDIKPDAADPGAIERLQRAQAEFDRSMAERKANEEVAAMRRDELNQRRRELEVAQGGPDSAAYPPDLGYGPDYGWYAPYPPYVMQRPKHFDHDRQVKRHRNAPGKSRVPAVIRRPSAG